MSREDENTKAMANHCGAINSEVRKLVATCKKLMDDAANPSTFFHSLDGFLAASEDSAMNIIKAVNAGRFEISKAKNL